MNRRMAICVKSTDFDCFEDKIDKQVEFWNEYNMVDIKFSHDEDWFYAIIIFEDPTTNT